MKKTFVLAIAGVLTANTCLCEDHSDKRELVQNSTLHGDTGEWVETKDMGCIWCGHVNRSTIDEIIANNPEASSETWIGWEEVKTVAWAFCKTIQRWLTKEQIDEIVKRWKEQAPTSIIHAYCDADLAMKDAFREMCKAEPDASHVAWHGAMIHAAYEAARTAELNPNLLSWTSI